MKGGRVITRFAPFTAAAITAAVMPLTSLAQTSYPPAIAGDWTVIEEFSGDPPVPPPTVQWDRIEREARYLDEMAVTDCDQWDDRDKRPSWC